MNEDQEAIQIGNDKGLCNSGFCRGARIVSVNDLHEIEAHNKVVSAEFTLLASQTKSTSHEPKKIGYLKKIILLICGVNAKTMNNPNIEVKMDTSIEETKFWSKICDIGTVISLAVCGFFFAFFNKFDLI